MTARKKEPGFKPFPSPSHPLYPNEQSEPKVSPLEPNCGAGPDDENADAEMSLAISARRQADALERIAAALERQNEIAASVQDFVDNIDGKRG